MTADRFGNIGVQVLATPMLVSYFELTAHQLAMPALEAGEGTVTTSASSSTCTGSWDVSPARSPKTMGVVGRTVPGARLVLGDVRSSRAHLDHGALAGADPRVTACGGDLFDADVSGSWGIAPDTHSLFTT